MLTKNEGFKKYYTPVISTSYPTVCDFCIGYILKKIISKVFHINALYIVEVAIYVDDRKQEI